MSWQDCSLVTACLGHGVLWGRVWFLVGFEETLPRSLSEDGGCVSVSASTLRQNLCSRKWACSGLRRKSWVSGAKGQRLSQHCGGQRLEGHTQRKGSVPCRNHAEDFWVELGVEAAAYHVPVFCFLRSFWLLGWRLQTSHHKSRGVCWKATSVVLVTRLCWFIHLPCTLAKPYCDHRQHKSR